MRDIQAADERKRGTSGMAQPNKQGNRLAARSEPSSHPALQGDEKSQVGAMTMVVLMIKAQAEACRFEKACREEASLRESATGSQQPGPQNQQIIPVYWISEEE